MNESIWDVGETVKKREDKKTGVIKLCPFKPDGHREVLSHVQNICPGAKCALWSERGGACAFVVIASGLYGGE